MPVLRFPAVTAGKKRMGFLAPAFWLGLLAVSVPLIIHLIGRRRLRRQPFPTLAFFKRLQMTKMRRLRLKGLLLLLMRSLTLMLLAVAFLRPVIESVPIGAGRGDAIIFLDLSASMEATRGEGKPISWALSLLEGFYREQSGGKTALVVMDKEGTRDIRWHDHDGTIPGWLKSLWPDGRSADYRAAWGRILKLLERESATNPDIIWLSDFCDDPPDVPQEIPEDLRIYRVPLAEEGEPINAAVTGAGLVSPTISSNEVVDFEIEVACYGHGITEEALFSVRLDSRVVAEGAIAIEPGGRTRKRFPVRISEPGRYLGEVNIEYVDALPLDNRYHFILNVPEACNILLVSEKEEASAYLQLALGHDAGKDLFNLSIRQWNEIPSNLSTFSLIVASGFPPIGEYDGERLVEYVNSGGGLWLMANDLTDLRLLNDRLLNPLGFGSAISFEHKDYQPLAWSDIDWGHPALERILVGRRKFDKPSVTRFLRVQEVDGDRVLIRLGNGAPFLIERSYGKGLVWWIPSSCDVEWTDWPTSGIFAPMAWEGARYLAHGRAAEPSQGECGSQLYWSAVPGEYRGVLEVRNPHGDIVPAVPGARLNMGVWITEATEWPGHYLLVDEDRVVDKAAVHIDQRESDLAVGDLDSPDWPGELISVRGGRNLREELAFRMYGREISKGLLLLCLLFLVVETLVSSDSRFMQKDVVSAGVRKASDS